jgi:hypothetical protein
VEKPNGFYFAYTAPAPATVEKVIEINTYLLGTMAGGFFFFFSSFSLLCEGGKSHITHYTTASFWYRVASGGVLCQFGVLIIIAVSPQPRPLLPSTSPITSTVLPLHFSFLTPSTSLGYLRAGVFGYSTSGRGMLGWGWASGVVSCGIDEGEIVPGSSCYVLSVLNRLFRANYLAVV